MADVLMLAGLHVPTIPSFDVCGSAGAVAFWQYELAIVGKLGETLPTIVTFIEACVAQFDVPNIKCSSKGRCIMVAGSATPSILIPEVRILTKRPVS